MNIYFFLFFFIILNLLIFLFHNFLSAKINIYDFPESRKIHKKIVPRIGGIYIAINITFYILLESIIEYGTFSYFKLLNDKFIFFLGLYLVLILGIADDKFQIKAKYKLFFFLIIFSLILILNEKIHIEKLEFRNFSFVINLESFDFIFTVLCFIIFVNAFNMFDGINCQAISYSIVFFLTLFYFHNLNILLIPIIIIFLLILLILNFQSRIFLGDGGSLSVSYIISYLIIDHYNNTENLIYADEIFLLMIYPGSDMLRLFILRALAKKNPLDADKSHMHHYLIGKFSSHISLTISFLMFSLPIIFYYFLKINFINIIFSFYFIYFSLLYYLKFRPK